MSVAPDTSLGGGARDFPVTTWGLVSRVGATGVPDGLDGLCRRYWKPIYHYVRTAWGKSVEDAKDLSQGFFLWLVEANPLAAYRAEKGSFRAFVKVLLWRFVNDHQKVAQALKRGGAVQLQSLETVTEDGRRACEAELDRTWALEMAQRAIERVKTRLAGRDGWFAVYEGYDLAVADRPTYAAIGKRLGMAEGRVRKILSAVRRLVRQEILDELESQVTSQDELAAEWKQLFGGRV